MNAKNSVLTGLETPGAITRLWGCVMRDEKILVIGPLMSDKFE
jgi:hypothetical protein